MDSRMRWMDARMGETRAPARGACPITCVTCVYAGNWSPKSLSGEPAALQGVGVGLPKGTPESSEPPGHALENDSTTRILAEGHIEASRHFGRADCVKRDGA